MSVPPSDSQIVRNVLGGETEAFGELVRRHLRAVHGLAYVQTGNHADAEDVTQEAFLTAFQSLDRLRDPGKFVAWVAAITRNVCNSKRRARKRELVGAAQVDESLSSETADIDSRELHGILRARMKRLNATQQEVLILHYFAGHSTREIANVLGISRHAAKKRLERARKALGTILVAELGDALSPDSPPENRYPRIMGAVVAAASLAGGSSARAAMVKTVGVIGGIIVMKKIVVGAVVLVLAVLGLAILSNKELPQEAIPPVPIEDVVAVDPVVETSEPAEDETAASAEPSLPAVRSEPARLSPPLEEGEITDPALYCSIFGTITGAEGRPLPGAEVTVTAFGYDKNDRAKSDSYRNRKVRIDRYHQFCATSDSLGRYHIKGIRFAVSATVLAYKKGYVSGWAYPDRRTPIVRFSPGDSLENIDIGLSQGSTLRGRVVTADYQPVSDAIVSILGVGVTGGGMIVGRGRLGGRVLRLPTATAVSR